MSCMMKRRLFPQVKKQRVSQIYSYIAAEWVIWNITQKTNSKCDEENKAQFCKVA